MKDSKTQTLNSFNEINELNELHRYQMNFIYLNIRSLRKNFNAFLTDINKILDKVKLIILVETNIMDEENCLYTIQNFNGVFLNRKNKGGGIAVYMRNDINFTVKLLNTKSFESLALEMCIEKIPIILMPIYRPPSLNVKDFINELELNMNLINKGKVLLVVGDMNINIAKEKDKSTALYRDMMSANGLQCEVNTITRDAGKGNGSCIDHMYVRTNKITTAQAFVIRSILSDHYAIFGCLKYTNKKNTKDQHVSSNIHCEKSNQENKVKVSIDKRKLNWFINNTSWDIVLNQNNTCEEKYQIVCKTFHEIYNKSKQNKRKLKQRNDFPWLNDQIIKYCDVRNKLYQSYKKSKNNTQKEKEYKFFNNKLNVIINNAKNEYRRREFEKNRNNIRGTWCLINDIIGKKTDNVDDVIKKNFKSADLKTITENFAVKFKENVNNIIHKCEIKTLIQTPRIVQNTIFLENTDEAEISNILRTLNVNKGAGVDGIRPIDIKNNARKLTPVITSLINSSIDEGIVPSDLKTSIVRPIYKSGTKSDYNNYRPISILPLFEKILEEVIVRRLNGFLNKYGIINRQQYGFQKGKNINKLLGHFSSYINKQLDNNMNCLVLFIDFSKAFDTLPHSNLLSVLERNGIRGQCLKWFNEYLHKRTFKVKIDANYSSEMQSNYGVPQGSKLGPILYLIYANELINVTTNSEAFAYADDTAIVVRHKDPSEAVKILQSEFNVISRWCHDNGLIINANKSKVMHIRQPHLKSSNIQIKFHNYDCLHDNKSTYEMCNGKCDQFLEAVDTYKYLGVTVDRNFNWKTHINLLNNKLRSTSYILYHLNNCAPLSITKQVYFTLGESHIRHGITAFGTSSHIKIIQKTQKRLIKTLMRNKSHKENSNILNTITHRNTQYTQNQNQHYEFSPEMVSNFLKQHNILNVTNLYKSVIMNEFDDINLLKPINHTYNTRRKSKSLFKTPKIRTKYGKNALNYQLPNTWNAMPSDIITITSQKKRKKEIKRVLIASQ